MFLPKNASRARQREAQHARDNRHEIYKALQKGEITKRDLFRWGILTTTGLLVAKHGLSQYAPSAFGKGTDPVGTPDGVVPTGTPRSPLYGAQKFTIPMQRLNLQQPIPLIREQNQQTGEWHARWSTLPNEPDAKRLSWHNEFTANPTDVRYRNPTTNRGPIEGRPPGEFYAHQRWDEFFPKVGYVMTLGRQQPETTRFHPSMECQNEDAVWSFGAGSYRSNVYGTTPCGVLPAPLIRARYGEPMIMRVYNGMPVNPASNGGFGRNQSSLHFHNAHNGAESDGASNAYHYPGTFYDYRWSTTLARRDKINTQAGDPRASGPDGSGGLVKVPGDFRELQGTMWYHDHRFFYTAENVYKGSAGMINYYSGPDRGHETMSDGVNLKLPSGRFRDWGNIDFDVNLMVSDAACDQQGQLFFDIFDTDGFLGDMLLVNHQYAPYMEVLPRKYRFRILNACMSRFVRLVLATSSGKSAPFQFIANDGNLVVNPITVSGLDEQGPAERYDIVVDFSQFRPGESVKLVNILHQINGRRPDGAVSLATALTGTADDPAVGPILEFRVVSGGVASLDNPGYLYNTANMYAAPVSVPSKLTEQIPVVIPVRERVVEFVRSSGDSRDPGTGQCVPDCPNGMPFPWSVKINGQSVHSMNANRVSLLIPRPGEIEHWTYINGGGGWDHPIHLHFEEGVTIDRGGKSIGPMEKNVRKDVWRLRPSGRVKFQVQFGEYGGSYVNHCHNTVHEDFAMLFRYQILGKSGTPQMYVTPTPIPSPDGVTFSTTPPEVLPEGIPPGSST